MIQFVVLYNLITSLINLAASPMNPAALNMTCVVSMFYLQKNFNYSCHHYFGNKFGFYISERYHSPVFQIISNLSFLFTKSYDGLLLKGGHFLIVERLNEKYDHKFTNQVTGIPFVLGVLPNFRVSFHVQCQVTSDVNKPRTVSKLRRRHFVVNNFPLSRSLSTLFVLSNVLLLIK